MNSSSIEVLPAVKSWSWVMMACLTLAGCSASRRDTMPASRPASVAPLVSAIPAAKPDPPLVTKSIREGARTISKPIVLPGNGLPKNPALEQYTRRVTSAIEAQWKKEVARHARDLVPGRLLLRFYVDRHGAPQDLQIFLKTDDTDPLLRELTLRAILDAQIPPIPPDLLPTLDNERVKIEYEAIVY